LPSWGRSMLRPYLRKQWNFHFKVVYHDKYDLNLGPHVFPSQKFRLIAEALIAEKIAIREDFVQPEPASDQDILRRPILRSGSAS